MSKNSKEPKYIASQLNTPMLNYKVYVMSKGEKLLYSILAILIGGIIGLVFYGGLFIDSDGYPTTATYISNTVVFLAAGLFARSVYIPTRTNQLQKKRKNELTLQFRSFLEAIAVSLSSGMNMNDAIKSARNDLAIEYSDNAYMVKEVDEMLSGIQNGVPIESMMNFLGKRSEIADIVNFANVFSISNRVGGNVKDIIRRTNQIISEKIGISQEIETAISSNKSQFTAMMVVPVIIVIMLKTMNSDFGAGFSTLPGVIATTIALAMFFGAYKLGQKIMDISE